jgi:hypothetical protein
VPNDRSPKVILPPVLRKLLDRLDELTAEQDDQPNRNPG